MADFSNIIQEINTNLPDNNSQAITAAKLRTTLIDLTNQIDTVQDDFETDIQGELSNLVIDNLTSTDTDKALSANQGKVLSETIDDVSNAVSNIENTLNFVENTLTSFSITNSGFLAKRTFDGQGTQNISYVQISKTTSSPYMSVAFYPIVQGRKYVISIPKTGNSNMNVWAYTMVVASETLSTTWYDPDGYNINLQGNEASQNITIDSALDYNYIAVCYDSRSSIPTVSEIYSELIDTVSTLQDNVENLQDDFDTLEGDVSTIQGDVENLQDDFEALDNQVNGVFEEQTQTIAISDVLIPHTSTFIQTNSTDEKVNIYVSTSYSYMTTAFYPIVQGRKYVITIPKTGNTSMGVWAYIDSLRTSTSNIFVYNGSYDGNRGNSGEQTITIERASNHNYIAVSYDSRYSLPTVSETTFILLEEGIVQEIETLQSDVEELQSEMEDLQPETIDIVLPDKIYAVVDDTLQLFYSGMIKAKNYKNYDIRVSCSKGAQYGRYFEYKPSISDVGTIPFNIEVRDNNGKLISTKSCNIVVVNKPVSPSNNINILCFGDSLTTFGQWPEEACRRLIGTSGTPNADGLSNISFCGSKHNNLAYYYGHGGWTWGSFTSAAGPQFRFYVSGISVEPIAGDTYSNNNHTYTVVETNISNGEGNILFSTGSPNNTPSAAPSQLTKISGNGDTTISYSSFANEAENPLWDETNNKMSFVPYVNQYCGQNEDVAAVYVLLTWNGLMPYMTDFSAMKNNIKTFADTLHAEYSNAKLKIMSVPMPSPYDAHAYGAGGNLETYSYSDTYALKITAMNMAKMYQEFANSDELSGTSGDAYNTFVEYVGVPVQYDCEYSVQLSKKIANTRIRIIDYAPNTRYELGTYLKYQNNYYVVSSIVPSSSTSFPWNYVQLFDPYETITGNTVHPAETGYMQIADAVYRNIVANFCQ